MLHRYKARVKIRQQTVLKHLMSRRICIFQTSGTKLLYSYTGQKSFGFINVTYQMHQVVITCEMYSVQFQSDHRTLR